jgi:hypothetical protein
MILLKRKNKKSMIIKQICFNCTEWQSTNNKKGECVKLDKNTGLDDTCSYYEPDPSRFCAICNSSASEDDKYNILVCDSNNLHFASYWDYEWVEIS